jgi:hypothetical protein
VGEVGLEVAYLIVVTLNGGCQRCRGIAVCVPDGRERHETDDTEAKALKHEEKR